MRNFKIKALVVSGKRGIVYRNKFKDENGKTVSAVISEADLEEGTVNGFLKEERLVETKEKPNVGPASKKASKKDKEPKEDQEPKKDQDSKDPKGQSKKE